VGTAYRKASNYTGQHNSERRAHTSMPLAGLAICVRKIRDHDPLGYDAGW